MFIATRGVLLQKSQKREAVSKTHGALVAVAACKTLTLQTGNKQK